MLGILVAIFLCAGAGFSQPGKEKGDVLLSGDLRDSYRKETDFQRCTARRQEAMDTRHK